MGSKTITDNVVSTLSKGPLVVFLAFGFALWQASYMTDQQLATLERLTQVLDNPVGASIYLAMAGLLFYAVVLYPTGKFVSTILTEFIEHQKTHALQHNEHVEASKQMFHSLESLDERCRAICARLDEFYGGKS